MAVRNILNIRNNMAELRRVSRPVERFDSRLHALLDDLGETMKYHQGAGLAAPQVGILRRAAVVVDETRPNGVLEIVNPIILSKEGEMQWEEGCLSVPGMRGLTTRPQKLRLAAFDRNGVSYELEAEDFLALAIIHETEHLDGKLYIDVVQGELHPEQPDIEATEEEALQ